MAICIIWQKENVPIILLMYVRKLQAEFVNVHMQFKR